MLKLPLFNYDELQRQLNESEIYEDNDGNKLQTIYLGSIISLTPSKKVYTPFANSNVKPCPQCKGKGNIPNPNKKKKAYNKARKRQRELQLLTINLSMWTKNQERIMNKCYKQRLQWQETLSCPLCYGECSLEARLDQDWWNQLERELGEINAFHHGSEGDGCDILISRMIGD